MASIVPGYEYDTCLLAGRSLSATAASIIAQAGKQSIKAKQPDHY